MIPAILAFLPVLSSTYVNQNVEGWTVQVESVLISDHPKEWASVQRELHKQLYQIVRVVPDEPLKKLRQITIWVHWDDPETPCMAYHPGADWLREHKVNPDMAKGVEISNAVHFVSWTYEQPWMVLHEMAHGYHDRFLEKGFDNPDIKAAWDAAMASKIYESVQHWNGSKTKHYACTNQMEYFAEASEAYFGTNDFYPFVNAELKSFDPKGFAALEAAWGKPQKRN
jgi:hypothetical protein